MTLLDWLFMILVLSVLLFAAHELTELWTRFVFWAIDRYFLWKDGKVSPEGSEFSEDDSISGE